MINYSSISLKIKFWLIMILIMLPSINITDLEAISEILENGETASPPAESTSEPLGPECSNSMRTMGPHMSFFYGDISIYRFAMKTLSYNTPKILCWKRFRDHTLAV